MLINFDIFSAASRASLAIVAYYSANADRTGKITLTSSTSAAPVWADLPSASGSRTSNGNTVARAIAALPVASPPPAANHTYYVSQATGSDENDGLSSLAAFATLTRAANTIGSGDVVVVYPGKYRENLCLRAPGTASNYSTWIAAARLPRPIIAGSSTFKCGPHTVGIFNRYTRFSGFAVTRPNDTTDTAGGIEVYSASRSMPTNTHHVIIENNLVYGCGGGGISSVGSDYVTIRNNIVHDNSWTNPNQSSGISLWENTNYDVAAGYHMIVINNISYSNIDRAPVKGKPYTTDGEGIILDNNTATSYTGAILVAANAVFNNGGRGIEVYHTNNVDIINNTSYGNATDTVNIAWPKRSGEIEVDNSLKTRVLSNIAQSYFSVSQVYALYETAAVGTIWSHNISYVGGAHSDDLGTPISITANKIGANPMFNNASPIPDVADFSLKNGSPAIGYAPANSFSYIDLNGATITAGAAHNAGAY